MDSTEYECDFESGVLTIGLLGEVDHHRAKDLRESIDRDILFYRPQKTVMDLSRIDFMDSSGLGLILGRYTKMKDMNGELSIKHPTNEIMKILTLAGVEKFISIEQINTDEQSPKRFKIKSSPKSKKE